MTGPVRSGRLAARLWWATLPYEGWVGYRDKDLEADGSCRKPPWYAWLLASAAAAKTYGKKLPGIAKLSGLQDVAGVEQGAVFEP